MTASILIFRNGQQSGPFPPDQVRQMLASGGVQSSDLAWQEGMAEWKPVTEVLTLAGGAAASGGALAGQAVPMMAAAAGGGALKWGLGAGAAVIVLALGGVGAWQYNEQQKIAAEQQRIAQEQQRMAELQAQEQERRLMDEKRKAEEETRRLAEEKKQAEARNQELEQRLADERREAEQERRAARQQEQRQQERQQRQYETRQQRMTQDLPNASGPYGYGQPPSVVPQQICRECGVVQSVRAVTHQGQGSGVGAVAGGVLGGVLGNQVGRGRGRDAATVVGVLGGAVAGHEIEKSQRTTTGYEISVRFDDGAVRTFVQEAPPPWRQGDRVRTYNGTLTGY